VPTMSVVSLNTIVNVASVPHRSPFRYPGGKTWLVPHVRKWLGSLTKRPTEFIEPFAGGGIVGLTVAFEELADHVTMIELDPNVAAVWQVILNGKGRKLAERILEFPFSSETVRNVLSSEQESLEAIAFSTLIRNRVQHGGILAPGASLMKEGENGKGIGSRWSPQTLARRILDIVSIKERVTFCRGDAFECLERNKRKNNCVFFIDPPYTIAGRRLYRFSDIDHDRLFKAASRLCGDFLITYDDSEDIRRLAEKHGFDTENVAMRGRLLSEKKELLISRDLNWARI